jgi:hypothetical protein
MPRTTGVNYWEETTPTVAHPDVRRSGTADIECLALRILSDEGDRRRYGMRPTAGKTGRREPHVAWVEYCKMMEALGRAAA